MGCCTSSGVKLPAAQIDLNATLNSSMYVAAAGVGVDSPSSKRSYSSRRSNGSSSSGVSSACPTPSRRSSWSRSSRNSRSSRSSSESTSPKPRPNQPCIVQRSICDDFAEQPKQPAQEMEERSCGYHTCSSAAEQTEPTSANELSDMAISDLEWEMYMMTHSQRIMPKTSSPISFRRDATFELLPVQTKSYTKWRNYLRTTPAHMLHNVTHIPEAIAGQFCPGQFPGYSDLEDMESAAKRYKVDRETVALVSTDL